jgi:hypothetical protein
MRPPTRSRHCVPTRPVPPSSSAYGNVIGGSKNGEHWVRDKVFGEHASTTHTGTAPQVFAAFRNLALSLLLRWRHRNLTTARESYASHPAALFRRLKSPQPDKEKALQWSRSVDED